MSNSTREKVVLSEDGKHIDSADGWIAEVTSWPTSPVRRVPEDSKKHKANGLLFVTAWNACVATNEVNPQAVAEAIPEIMAALEKLRDWRQLDAEEFENKYGAQTTCGLTAPTLLEDLFAAFARATTGKEAA